jgi:hypothetical protein
LSEQPSAPLRYWLIVDRSDQLEDIVAVFPEYTAGSLRGRFKFWSHDHSALGYSLGEFVHSSPQSTVTLVGLDEMTADFGARYLELLREGVKEALELHEKEVDPQVAEDKVDALMAKVVTMSMEGYARVVDDDDTLALEIVDGSDALFDLE